MCGFVLPILCILKTRSSGYEAGRQGKEDLGPVRLSSSKHTPVTGVLQFPEEQCWAQVSLPSMGVTCGGGVEDGAFEEQESGFPIACMYLWGQRARTDKDYGVSREAGDWFSSRGMS